MGGGEDEGAVDPAGVADESASKVAQKCAQSLELVVSAPSLEGVAVGRHAPCLSTGCRVPAPAASLFSPPSPREAAHVRCSRRRVPPGAARFPGAAGEPHGARADAGARVAGARGAAAGRGAAPGGGGAGGAAGARGRDERRPRGGAGGAGAGQERVVRVGGPGGVAARARGRRGGGGPPADAGRAGSAGELARTAIKVIASGAFEVVAVDVGATPRGEVLAQARPGGRALRGTPSCSSPIRRVRGARRGPWRSASSFARPDACTLSVWSRRTAGAAWALPRTCRSCPSRSLSPSQVDPCVASPASPCRRSAWRSRGSGGAPGAAAPFAARGRGRARGRRGEDRARRPRQHAARRRVARGSGRGDPRRTDGGRGAREARRAAGAGRGGGRGAGGARPRGRGRARVRTGGRVRRGGRRRLGRRRRVRAPPRRRGALARSLEARVDGAGARVPRRGGGRAAYRVGGRAVRRDRAGAAGGGGRGDAGRCPSRRWRSTRTRRAGCATSGSGGAGICRSSPVARSARASVRARTT